MQWTHGRLLKIEEDKKKHTRKKIIEVETVKKENSKWVIKLITQASKI